MTPGERDWIIEAIYRALVRYDHEKRTLRDLRSIHRGQGPTIKRGSVRSALAVYLADVVIAGLPEVRHPRCGLSNDPNCAHSVESAP